MAQFPRIKLLIAMKQKFNGSEFYKEMYKFGYFKELEKSVNKVCFGKSFSYEQSWPRK